MVRPIDTANLLDQLEALAGPKKSIMPSSALDRLKHLDFSSLNKSLDYGDVHVPRLVGDDMEDNDERKDHEEGEDDDIGKASDSDFVLQALKDETKGMSSYDQALQTVQDPKLKEILEAIKEDETKHNAALEAWLKDNDPDALEGHEGEEIPGEESEDGDGDGDGDEAAEGLDEDVDEPGEEGLADDDEDTEKDDEPSGDKSDLIDDIREILAQHEAGEAEKGEDGPGEDEDDLEKGDGEGGEDEEAEKRCSKSIHVPIIKGDQQIVYGVVSEPDTIDLQGDRLSKAEIVKACHKFMMESQKIGKEHTEEARADIIESYIAPVDFKCHGQIVKAGSWVMAVKVHDPALWKAIKKGEITGFSIAGRGDRKPF